jgi:hypothetical protein
VPKQELSCADLGLGKKDIKKCPQEYVIQDQIQVRKSRLTGRLCNHFEPVFYMVRGQQRISFAATQILKKQFKGISVEGTSRRKQQPVRLEAQAGQIVRSANFVSAR